MTSIQFTLYNPQFIIQYSKIPTKMLIDKKIIYWLTFIISSLVIASTMGLIGMYGTHNIITKKSVSNEKSLSQIIDYHNHDVELIRYNIRDIKSDQQIIKDKVNTEEDRLVYCLRQ